MTNDVIKGLAELYNVQVFIHGDDGAAFDYFIPQVTIHNNCFCNRKSAMENPGKYIGQVFVGPYSNQERRMLSFLHELSHLLFDDNNPLFVTTIEFIELRAWLNALKLARKHKIYFRGNVYEWIEFYVATYNHSNYKVPKPINELMLI